MSNCGRSPGFDTRSSGRRVWLAALLAAPLIALTSGCSKQADPDAGASNRPVAGSSSSGAATVSRYDAGPRAFETERNEERAEQGKTLFQTKGCAACHGFGVKSAGPDLAGVSKRRTAAWMEQQILHPEVMVKEDPVARGLFAQFALQMPNQGVTPEEARAIIEFFKHQDHEASESHSRKE